jgi:hypothetical protein
MVPDSSNDDAAPSPRPLVTRVVSSTGWISLIGVRYHAGRWLAGKTVQVGIFDGLVELSHGGVIIATHARRHPVDKEPAVFRSSGPRQRPSPGTPEVTRKVDGSGYVNFAGWSYRAGNAYRRRQVQVSIAGDTVHITFEGRLVRSHPIRHDRSKEHGALANPGGKPRRINAALNPTPGVAKEPEPIGRAGTGNSHVSMGQL